MSKRRRMRHVAVDAGDGITAMVRMRGPMTPELNAAFAELARLALLHHVDRTEETPADREAEALRRCASYPATSSDAEAVAFADADYVLRWLEQTNAPANIIGLQRRVRAALAGVTDTRGDENLS